MFPVNHSGPAAGSTPAAALPPRSSHRVAAVLAIAALTTLVIVARLPEGPHYLYVLHKLGHPLAFALIAWLIHTLRHGKPNYAVTLMLALLLGAATELAQAAIARDARWSDVLRDGLGASAALATHAWWQARRTESSLWYRRGYTLLACTLWLLVMAPLLWCIAAYTNRAAQFPILAQFRTPLDRYFLATNGARLETDNVSGGLRVTPDEHGSGLGINEPAQDWSGYSTLVVDVGNPNNRALTLMLRIHDRQHNWEHRDRYNGLLRIAPNTQQKLRIPLGEVAASPNGRALDLHQVAGIALFVPHGAPPLSFVVTTLRLE